MNPALLLLNNENAQKALKGLLVAGGLFLGYKLSVRAVKNYRARGTAALADQSPEVRTAMALRAALNPSGMSWLMWSDGTKEQVVAQAAQQITDLEAVASAYRRLYGGELIAHLQNELNAQDFNAFLQTVASNRINTSSNSAAATPAPSGAYTAPYRLIAAKKAVYVRTSPDASYHGAWYEIGEEDNLFGTAQPGDFIGYATGRQHFDSANNVKFIEVTYRIGPGAPPDLQDRIGEVHTLWVSSSATYTAQFSSTAALAAAYPGAAATAAYLVPPNGLNHPQLF